jgi:glycosyltransferase involved in cell wall biosynthesis
MEIIKFQQNPYPYYKNANVFVLSSNWEGFGNVLVEAMACGTPVITTDCPGGPKTILKGGKFGDLVPVGDADILAEAIVKRLYSAKNVNLLREAQNRALEFSIQNSAKLYKIFF